ncbi:MAG: ubiquinol-cytochrome c reductase iron-sulfur subunit, partial [Pirellulales bacterium]|nr:ubiquinol-cytochrome c reductase iron-sulfur subunit [Pirellulales bacterium]
AREPKGAAREPKSAACCHGKPDSSHINPAPTRRSMLFSGFTLGLAALGSVFGLWGAATLRFFFPNIITEPPNRFRVGFPTDYAPGQVETRFKEQYGVWVVNGTYNGKQQIYALSTVCTHLGCITLWLDNEQKFKCPCHGSGFYRDGINYEGPAPRPLERYAIRIAEDGQLEVDKSKRFQEELGQWNDPSCFVQV